MDNPLELHVTGISMFLETPEQWERARHLVAEFEATRPGFLVLVEEESRLMVATSQPSVFVPFDSWVLHGEGEEPQP